MRSVESVEVGAPPDVVFGYVERLDRYPEWMPLVHRATASGEAAWEVELRAQVGPFARSKQLRMERVEHLPAQRVSFERRQLDRRQHARWAMTARLDPTGTGTLLTVELAYDGRLWTGGVLERVLDDQVRRAKQRLTTLIAGG